MGGGGGGGGRRGVGGGSAEQKKNKKIERKFERSERSKHIKGSIYFLLGQKHNLQIFSTKTVSKFCFCPNK